MTGETRFSIAAAITTILCIAILCGLGVWQVQRLAWKTELLKQLDAEYAKDAAHTPLTAADLKGDALFRRGMLRGVYALDKQVLVGPRVYEELPGWHLLTPLKLANHSYVLVDRGWVPQDWKPGNENAPPHGSVTVTGLLRHPDPPNPFTPPNDPARNQWYNTDIGQIAEAEKLPWLAPVVLYEEGKDTAGEYPIPQAKRPEFSNNHLQYAALWFAMAAALAVIFGVRFFKKEKR